MAILSPGHQGPEANGTAENMCVRVCVCCFSQQQQAVCIFKICRCLLCICASVYTNWTCQEMSLYIKIVCARMPKFEYACAHVRLLYKKKNKHLYLIVLVTGLCLLQLTNKPLCFTGNPVLTPSSHLSLSPFPPGIGSHTKYRAARNEEERKEVLVQSEVQMATEDMNTSQSGTRTTSTCQIIHKSNVTPLIKRLIQFT